jgi:polar amino acid transport system substrate-binding protein
MPSWALPGLSPPGLGKGKEAMSVKTSHLAMVRMGVMAFLMVMGAGTPLLFADQSPRQPMVMATIQGPTDYYGKWGELIYTEAFRRLNVDLVIKVYPLERANLMVSRKQVDGDIGRSFAFYESYPHLIQVQAFPFSMKLSAFAVDPGIRIDGWESLRKTPYRVEYLRGSKLLPKKLAPLVAPEKLSSVTHWVQGLKKLMAGRTDIFLEAEGIVLYYLENDAYFKDVPIHIAGVLLESPVHAYLQPEHAELASQLSSMLEKMKAEGVIEKFQRAAIEATGGLK